MTQFYPRLYSRLVFLAFALAFIVILLGAYTRLTNAGLSCPDWPRCYGYITPPETTEQIQNANIAYPHIPVDKAKAWAEMRHRYLAGLESILILLITSLSWYWQKNLRPLVFKLSLCLPSILLCQVLLGMLTVTALLKPVVVLGHLLFGFLTMSILWVIVLLQKKKSHEKNDFIPLPFKPWITMGLLILALQITLGGWVSTHYAGLACIDFPYCNGTLLPTLKWHAINSDLITIHMLHRVGALITFLYFGILSLFLTIPSSYTNKRSRCFGLLLIVLLASQIILGIFNIIWLRPLPIALLHHAVAALLLLTSLAMTINVHSKNNGINT